MLGGHATGAAPSARRIVPELESPESIRGTHRPSPIFVGLLALWITGGWIAYAEWGNDRVGVFVFVVCGWLVSLCLHEYAHALTAYRSGDTTVRAKGYLTLDPRRYSDVALSIVLPVLFVILGGIGLPGGAVWINRGLIPGRLRHTLVSAAGPLINVAFAVGLIGAFRAAGTTVYAHRTFWAAVAFLAMLQLTASLLNLLPVPGLDGFGIWEPWLPPSWVRQAGQISAYGMLLVFGVLWLPPVNHAFFDVVFRILDTLGLPGGAVDLGQALFRFWSSVS
jgi:Zn-dependent protease